MAHPNADLVRKGFDAMAAGDAATMGELIADDAKWHWPGTSRIPRDIEGKETILAMMAVMPEGTTSWESDLHAVLADDEHAVALIKNTVVRDGETFQNDLVQVFHISNGKLTEAWGTPIDYAAFEAIWA
jgi:ketosteroid isomerase-like protein